MTEISVGLKPSQIESERAPNKMADRLHTVSQKVRDLLSRIDTARNKDARAALVAVVDYGETPSVSLPPEDRNTLIAAMTEASGDHAPPYMVDMIWNQYQKSVKNAADRHVDIDRARSDVLGIISEGKLDGHPLAPSISAISSEGRAMSQRTNLMRLYGHNQEFARAIVERGVSAAHMSTSASLLGVLEHGLKPQDYLRDRDIPVASGEGIFGSYALNNRHVSVAEWFDTMQLNNPAYRGDGQPITANKLKAEIAGLDRVIQEQTTPEHPNPHIVEALRINVDNKRRTLDFLEKPNKSPREALHAELIAQNFPVLYLMSAEGVDHSSVQSVGKEMAVKGGFAKENTKIIAVPAEHVPVVAKRVAESGSQAVVMPLEDLDVQ